MATTTNAISRISMSGDSHAWYLYDRYALEENVREMNIAYREHYGNFRIAYSYKTNYLADIVRTVKRSGCMAEVVSPYELKYAQAQGNAPDNIVYNGVIPDVEGKFLIAVEGGIVNVDNYEEYLALSEKARERDTRIAIGVRVNIDIGNGVSSRFGVDADSETFEKMMLMIAEDRYVDFGGFHCHIGTSRPVKYWVRKIEQMILLAKAYGAKYIDLGGGMFGPMSEDLSAQFSEYTGSYEIYGREVGSRMKDAYPDESVLLIVEPGTALVGNTFSVMAHITSIKDVRGQKYITVDCSSNHIGFLCDAKDIPFTIYRTGVNERQSVENAVICGNTCLEYDYIRKNVNADHIAIGDTIVFENTGAYSISACRQFIVPKIGVIDFGTGEVLQRPETAREMFSSFTAVD